MKPLPILAHIMTNALIKKQFIGFTLIFRPDDQRLVLEAIILDVRTRDDVVYLVFGGIRQLGDVQGLARIHALAALHEVERQPFIKVGWCGFLDLRPNLRGLFLHCRKRLFDLVVPPARALALVLRVFIAGNLDEDVRRVTVSNLGNLIHNAHCLVKATTNSR